MTCNCGKVSAMFPDYFVNDVPDRSHSMLARRRRSSDLALAIVIVAAVHCDGQYELASDGFQRLVQPFVLPDATHLTSLYANNDVNAAFGRYDVRNPASALRSIDDRAAANGWSILRKSEGAREFDRRTPNMPHTSEVVRVACFSNCSRVYVAWLQIDDATTQGQIATSHNGEWAEKNFWPRFDRAARDGA